MSGGGSSPAPAVQPSTTTTIQDIPAWEQGYVTNLLGQAQTIAAQPYQQFPGQQVAGFTPDQTQAFSNIEGSGAANQATQDAALGQAGAGANTANSIYGAGSGDINAATGYNPLAATAPYLGAASGYNSAAAGQPWMNQAAGLEQGAAANTQMAGAYNPLSAVAPYAGAANTYNAASAEQPWLNQAQGLQGASGADIQGSTGYNPLAAYAPYAGAANTYNAAAAAQPGLNASAGYTNASANAATPQGIQNYLNPYTNNVVQGLQNEAMQNWNQNIMPGLNNEFVGSGQSASGRNAQVLGQAAGNFQTGLSSNIANALAQGYTTAGQQAGQEAGILGNAANTALGGATAAGGEQTAQIGNLLNTGAGLAGATQQGGANLLNAGTALGNLGNQALQGAQTAGGAQTAQIGNLLNTGSALGSATQQQAGNLLNIGSGLGSLGSQSLTGASTAGNLQNQQIGNLLSQASTAGNATQNQAANLLGQGTALGNLAATQGTQQLNAAGTLGNLGAQNAATNLTQNQALQGVGQQQQQLNQTNLNTAQQNFQNQVNWPAQQTEYLNQIIRGLPAPSATTSAAQTPAYSVSPLSGIGGAGIGALALTGSNGNPLGTVTRKTGGLVSKLAEGGMPDDGKPSTDLESPPIDMSDLNPLSSDQAAPSAAQNPLDIPKPPQYAGISPGQMQQMQLLALARGMLTPQQNGSSMAALGQGMGNMSDIAMKLLPMQQQQQQMNYENQMKQVEAQQNQEKIDQGKYTPVKDFYGNVTGMANTKTGEVIPTNKSPNGGLPAATADEAPSSDPQKAAAQILLEQGSVPTQVGNRMDITGRNKQTDAYNNQALAAKNVIQQLDSLDAQTGKYTPGKGMGNVYGAESYIGMGGDAASARTEADKASVQLANAFMQANTAANRSGIGVLNFDAKGVPNADMPDDARGTLIAKQKAIANSQIERANISNMYPRMQEANVNQIMNTYEAKNPPLLPNGDANPNWMKYSDWLKSGRPDTVSAPTGSGGKSASNGNPQPQKIATQADIAETAAKSGKSPDMVKQALISKGYTIQ